MAGMTLKQATELLAKQQAQIDALQAAQVKGIRLKVSDKGGLSIYGLGRFPFTFYRSQLEAFVGAIDSDTDTGLVSEVKKFCREHIAELKVKPGYTPVARTIITTDKPVTPSQELAGMLENTGNGDLAEGNSETVEGNDTEAHS